MVKKKLGMFSIILLGLNAIIGSGIFLLPNQAMKLMGSASLLVFLFDMLLVISVALCFAEASSLFKTNGGPYVYAKEAFGNFVGFEVGFIKWAISIIAWATMAVAFATALGEVWAPAKTTLAKDIIVVVIIVGLGTINILGVELSKILNNIVTVSKLVPLILFIAVGIFFIHPGNFSPLFPNGTYESGSFGQASLLIFYAFTGFESIAVAAEDMDNPQKNLPRAIVTVMLIVSFFYIAIQAVSIGILGSDLANQATPIQSAMGKIMGPFGSALVAAGTLVSIGGINIASSFLTPRSGVALADDGMIPKIVSKRGKRNTPYMAIIISCLIAIPIALSGSFTTLAAISVVSRFAQYVPTCLSILVFRKTRKDQMRSFKVPFGPVVPIVAVIVSIWLLTNASLEQLLWGFGGLIVAIPFYFVMGRKGQKKTV